MGNKPKNIKSLVKADHLKYGHSFKSTPEAPQHTAQFSRVGFLILVAVSLISISLIVLAIW